jgi:hypothetical protein
MMRVNLFRTYKILSSGLGGVRIATGGAKAFFYPCPTSKVVKSVHRDPRFDLPATVSDGWITPLSVAIGEREG